MMWMVITIFSVIASLGVYGISTQHSDLVKQNQQLKTEVKVLKNHQITEVTQLDGVAIKNLELKGR